VNFHYRHVFFSLRANEFTVEFVLFSTKIIPSFDFCRATKMLPRRYVGFCFSSGILRANFRVRNVSDISIA